MNMMVWIVLTENQSCSSGKFPRTHNTAVAPGDPNDGVIQLEQFKDRIIFKSMWKDIHWTKVGNKETWNSSEDSLKDVGHSSDQELKKSGTERTPRRHTFVEYCC